MKYQRLLSQRAAVWLVWIMAGFLALGTLLDAIGNAYTVLRNPATTYWGTLTGAFFWLITRRMRVSWVAKNGQPTTLRGLGPQFTFGLIGCLFLLWVPRIWPDRQAPDSEQLDQKEKISPAPKEAQEALSDGIRYLKYYDLLNAERHFCRAKRIDPKLLRARLYLARTWRARGYDDAAAKEAQAILDLAKKTKVDQGEVRLYEAFNAEAQGKWKEAIEDYHSLWDEGGPQSFDVFPLVEALNLAGQNRLALETIDEIHARYASAKVNLGPLDEARLDIERAIALMKGGSAKQQLAAAKKAERAALGEKSKTPAIDNTYILARAQFVQCDALSKMQEDYGPTCKEALLGFQRQGDSVDVAKVYQVLGRSAAVPRQQLAYYRKAHEIYSRAGFQRGISDVLVEIALLLTDVGRESQAGLICGAAVHLAGQIASLNVPDMKLDCTYYAEILDKDFEGAENEATEVLALARQQGNRKLEAAALHDLAYAAHAGGRLTDALQWYRDAIAMGSELEDDSWDSRQTIFLYAWLLADVGHVPEAREALDLSLKGYSADERARNVADVVCWDRSYLGLGTAKWLQMLNTSASFTPKHCDLETKEPEETPLENLDALSAKVEVEEPHC